MIHIAKPGIGREEIRAVTAILKSGNLAQGKIVEQFEQEFAKFIGAKYAVAVSNGTAALYLALLALGIKQNDEVITSPFSFIASANAILYTGAKPVFADIDPQTFTIDPKKIESKITKRTKAILPVHLYGLPADMTSIRAIAKKHNLAIVEDACQAHGAKIANKYVGTLGNLACFSFYPTKNMTTGEGGMVTTNNKHLAEKLRLLRSHGMKKRYHHTSIGYNLRMTDIAAAVGREQLKKLQGYNRKREANAKLYIKYLSDVKGIIVPSIPKNYSHVFHQFTIRVTSEYRTTRDKLIKILRENDIASEVYYPIPIHQQIIYKELGYKDKLPIAERLAKEVLSVPIHPGLKINDIKKVINNLI